VDVPMDDCVGIELPLFKLDKVAVEV